MSVLGPINGVRTFSCQSATHERCTGVWWSFTRGARVTCGCECHQAVAT